MKMSTVAGLSLSAIFAIAIAGCSSSPSAPPDTSGESSQGSSEESGIDKSEKKWDVQYTNHGGSIHASDGARAALGVDRWQIKIGDDKSSVVATGLDAEGASLGTLELRRSETEGKKTFVAAFTDSDGTVTSATIVSDADGQMDGKPVSNLTPKALSWVDYLQKDVEAFQKDVPAPYATLFGCIAAGFATVGAGLAVVGTCVTPAVVAVVPCASSIAFTLSGAAWAVDSCFL
jgi:hypothetical protein